MNYTLTTPLITLAILAMALLMLGAFSRNAKLVGACTFAGMLALGGYTFTHPAVGQAFLTSQGPLLSFSSFTNLAAVLLLGLGALASLLNGPFYTQHKAYRPEIYVLFTLSLAGMMVLMAAADMLTLYLGLELMSFPLYILAATLRENAKSSEAALKYFVLGGLTSGLLLFGISLVYASTGTVHFGGIMSALAGAGDSALQNPLLLVGLALVLVAFLFKLSVVPFHMWTPDVYDGAPTPVTALMAALPKLAVIVALIRFVEGPLATQAALWQPALAALAVLSMVLGSAVAIIQTNLKRLLAWSTIAHVGFVFTGVVAASLNGASGVLLYLTIYGLTTLGLFAALISLNATTTDDLKGLAQTRPMMAVTMLVLLFSLAGVPPFAGFMAKFAVFSSAVQAGYTWLALAGVLASVVAAFYSLWLVKLMYFDTPTQVNPNAPSPHLNVVMAVAVAGTVLLGIFPELLANLTLPAATALF